jgi:hypothetical protein
MWIIFLFLGGPDATAPVAPLNSEPETYRNTIGTCEQTRPVWLVLVIKERLTKGMYYQSLSVG